MSAAKSRLCLPSSGGVWPILSNWQPLTFYQNPMLLGDLPPSESYFNTYPPYADNNFTLWGKQGVSGNSWKELPVPKSRSLFNIRVQSWRPVCVCATPSESYIPPIWGQLLHTLKKLEIRYFDEEWEIQEGNCQISTLVCAHNLKLNTHQLHLRQRKMRAIDSEQQPGDIDKARYYFWLSQQHSVQ